MYAVDDLLTKAQLEEIDKWDEDKKSRYFELLEDFTSLEAYVIIRDHNGEVPDGFAGVDLIDLIVNSEGDMEEYKDEIMEEE